MSEKLSREELVNLVESIMTVRDKKTGAKHFSEKGERMEENNQWMF